MPRPRATAPKIGKKAAAVAVLEVSSVSARLTTTPNSSRPHGISLAADHCSRAVCEASSIWPIFARWAWSEMCSTFFFRMSRAAASERSGVHSNEKLR